ncbi:terminase TerL endonuclease subunit [Lactobacillus terrae]|uniref:terminase large subunit n=1 Tax=Lactobacillus terrae TaxID=2269374 RepID=UPI000C1B7278
MIVNEKIKSSKAVYLAAKRHLNDLERIENDDFPYTFDQERVEKVIKFMEILPDPKGYTHGLAKFQKFIIGNLYGWVYKDDPEKRRFNKAYISVARKNGKTLLVAGIILYEFLFGKNPLRSRQIFCTANDKAQAKICYEMARKGLEQLRRKYPDVVKSTQIKKGSDELINLEDDSYVRPLSRDTGAFDGFEPQLGVLDEYGASKTTEMMELISSGQSLLKNPLIVIISTANFNLNAPMYTVEYPRAKEILNGEIEDEHYFAYIAEQESIEEIEDSSNWIKSNPILEVEELREHLTEFIQDKWTEAKQTGETNSVLVKHFNMWRQAGDDSYLDTETWNKTLLDYKPSIKGQDVWFGVDAGKSSDLFSISWFTPVEGNWYLDSYSFIGTKYGLDRKIKSDRMDYRKLADQGDCELTTLESGVIDNDRVYEWLDNFVRENDLNVRCISFDPAGFGVLLGKIEREHPEWPMEQIRQGTITLSEPTHQFRDDLYEGKVMHSDNEILRSSALNAITKVDNNGMRIDKARNSNKIDAMDATLDAFTTCFREDINEFLITEEYIMSDDFGF